MRGAQHSLWGMNILANQYVNKVIIGTEVKLDLTQDDITPDKLAEGVKAHDRTGAPIVGTKPIPDCSVRSSSARSSLTLVNTFILVLETIAGQR